MALNTDPRPCFNCGQFPAECKCTPVEIDEALKQGFTIKLDNQTVGNVSAQSYTYTWPTSFSGTYSWPQKIEWETGANFPNYELTKTPCTEHTVDVEKILIVDGEIRAECANCDHKIVLPHVPGGLTFEHAGSLIGRAMTLDDDCHEAIGELLAELKILEEQIEKEEARYKRARAMVKIARGAVAKHAQAE